MSDAYTDILIISFVTLLIVAYSSNQLVSRLVLYPSSVQPPSSPIVAASPTGYHQRDRFKMHHVRRESPPRLPFFSPGPFATASVVVRW